MYCCTNCFGDSFLDKHIPKISKRTGVCDFCSTIDTALVEPTDLLDNFQAVSSIYAEDNGADSKLLVSWFRDDWQIFSFLDSIKAQSLLGEILDDGFLFAMKLC